MSFVFQLRCWFAQIPEYTSLTDALLETQNSCSILPQGQNAQYGSTRHTGQEPDMAKELWDMW